MTVFQSGSIPDKAIRDNMKMNKKEDENEDKFDSVVERRLKEMKKCLADQLVFSRTTVGKNGLNEPTYSKIKEVSEEHGVLKNEIEVEEEEANILIFNDNSGLKKIKEDDNTYILTKEELATYVKEKGLLDKVAKETANDLDTIADGIAKTINETSDKIASGITKSLNKL